MQERLQFSITESSLKANSEEADRFVYSRRFVPLSFRDSDDKPFLSASQANFLAFLEGAQRAEYTLRRNELRVAATVATDPGDPRDPRMPSGGAPRILVTRPDDDVTASLTRSELGVLFLERTRVRPSGFCLGEHLHSLSLAPGEEVVIEQKSYTERLVTTEDVIEQGTDLETEFNSTLSQDLTTSFNRALSQNEGQTRQFGLSGGVQYEGIGASANLSESKNVSEADSTTAQSSLRNALSTSSKVAARFRQQHKVTFKISETTRFEATTKRTMRNPNAFTPIDLVYFKIMQKLKLAQERYGLRLCWVPAIFDPGASIENAAAVARAAFVKEYLDRKPLPQAPEQPTPPTPLQPITSGITDWELWDWGLFGDMRAEYKRSISPPQAGYVWNGNKQAILDSFSYRKTGWGDRGEPNVYITNVGINQNMGVDVGIHGGADAGGAGAHLYISFTATFVPQGPTDNPEYRAKLDEWNAKMKDWEEACALIKSEAEAYADTKMKDWWTQFRAGFNQVEAIMRLLIQRFFAKDTKIDFGEVDLWTTMFDLENALVRFYPSWWANRPVRDPSLPADDFINASWARLFLPIRIGYEERALRWIYARAGFTSGAVSGDLKKAIDDVAKQVYDYRKKYLGGEEEVVVTPGTPCPLVTAKYVCLGEWMELTPTDGTHLEVLQPLTNAVDDASEKQLAEESALRVARSDALEAQSSALGTVQGAVSGTTPLTINLNVGDNDGGR